MRSSRHLVAGAPQHAGEPDQGQAGKGGRVAALDRLEERDAQGLHLESPGAVERTLAGDIALNFHGVERTETDDRPVEMAVLPVPGIYHVNRGQEGEFATGGIRELLPAAVLRSWFTEDLPVAYSHLVGADHERVGKPQCDGLRLQPGEAGTQTLGLFTGHVRLVHPGWRDLERQAEPLEQLPAVARCGGQNQAGKVGLGHGL